MWSGDAKDDTDRIATSETIMKGSEGASGAAGRSPVPPMRSGVRIAEREKGLTNPLFSSGQLEGLRGD